MPKIILTKPFSSSAVKEFTDRLDSRMDFWNCYKMIENGRSTVISFFGAGGVGKTALLEKIEEEIERREIKYIRYDFSAGTDLREVLKTLKFQLSNYGCEFPFFDSGNYYYSLKIGQDITPVKAKSMMESIPWVKEINDKLWKIDKATGKAYPFLRLAKGFFTIADEIFQITSIPRLITTCFSVVDELLMYYMKKNKIEDEYHKAVRNELNALRQKRNSNALYEYLPRLFAIDVADWIEKTNNKLIIILDNYESLISATSTATTEQLNRDLWIRGNSGLIFAIPNTLWAIAGRNELHWNWEGELAEDLKQCKITAFSDEDSDEFLARAGIDNKTLRGELVKLTKGYPIFLDLCVDVYFEYKLSHDDEPTIDKFGNKHEEVVGRIFRYLDESGDDVAKDMLEFLCVLNVWTDEIAIDIGSRVLKNFSRNTYKRVKNFSLIHSEHVENESLSLTIFKFDKTIQSLLIYNCDQKFIDDVKIKVDAYFSALFTNKKVFDAQEIFCLRFWANFIVRFADNADSLLKHYNDNLNAPVSILTNRAHFDASEEILKLFMNKFESLGVTNTISYTYFEMALGWLRREQGKYNEAYEIINSAYEKRSRLLGNEHIETDKAIHKLAISLSDLGRYEEAKELQEKVLTLRKKFFGEENLDTIAAMNNLANSLSSLGYHKKAKKLQKKVLELSKEIHGDKHSDTIAAMNNLALSLSSLGCHKEAKELQEKVLELSKEIHGDKHPYTIVAMSNLALSLDKLGRYKEAKELQEKVLALSKEILGEEHPDTLIVMNNLANSLRDLGHYEEALNRKKRLLALRQKILGKKHPDTIAIMINLALSVNDIGRYDKAAKLQEKVLALSRIVLGEEHPYTIVAMSNLALSLDKLGRYKEAMELQEKAAALNQRHLDDKNSDMVNTDE